MANKIKGFDKQMAMVFDAARRHCNTTRGIADETGLSVAKVSHYISELIAMKILKRTGRTIPNINAKGSGRPYQVFEVAE